MIVRPKLDPLSRSLCARSSIQLSPGEEPNQRQYDDRERSDRIKAYEHGEQDAKCNANDPVSEAGHAIDSRTTMTGACPDLRRGLAAVSMTAVRSGSLCLPEAL